MDSFLNLLTLGIPGLVHSIAGAIAEEAEKQMYDKDNIMKSLLELQQRYEAGEVGDKEYDELEKILLERLETIREFESRQNQ